MITYEWKIEQCEYLTENGLITTAHWRCNALGDTYTAYTATSYGSTGVGGEPGIEPEIPYENVVQQNVLDWIWANGVDKEEIEAGLAAQIEALKHPKSQSGTPWASNNI